MPTVPDSHLAYIADCTDGDTIARILRPFSRELAIDGMEFFAVSYRLTREACFYPSTASYGRKHILRIRNIDAVEAKCGENVQDERVKEKKWLSSYKALNLINEFPAIRHSTAKDRAAIYYKRRGGKRFLVVLDKISLFSLERPSVSSGIMLSIESRASSMVLQDQISRSTIVSQQLRECLSSAAMPRATWLRKFDDAERTIKMGKFETVVSLQSYANRLFGYIFASVRPLMPCQ